MARGLFAIAAVTAIGLTVVGCNPHDYCLNCAKDDGGVVNPGDAAPDAVPDAFVEPDGEICTPTNGGVEICDGKDNDCDGRVDEGTLPGIGVTCGSNVGTCTTGSTVCTAGAIVCTGIGPTPEVCDGLDNNCDGVVDDGDPGGGASCGIAKGLCTQGVMRCESGALTCVGGVQPTAEICNGADDDCDGIIDEDVPTNGSCGHAAEGLCTPGTETCVGGGYVCVGGVNPVFELCNHLDDDCDGVVDNGYDTKHDPQNCGDCTYTDTMGVFHNNVCPLLLNVAIAGCAPTAAAPNGACNIAECDPNYYDINKAVPGCETFCLYDGPTEVCNGRDDNCDGQLDKNPDGSPLTPPPGLCSQVGACNGATPLCDGSDGWVCVYPAGVSTVASTDGTYRVIVPETTCNNVDDDCNGIVDDPFVAALNKPCHDNNMGVCQGTGTTICAASHTTTQCNITGGGTPGSAGVEICNGLDDDCDGVVDNGAATGNLPGQNWVTLVGTTGTTQIMEYEAARPDATATSGGADQVYACSQAGVQPWTNVTYPQAVAACTSIGARICTEAEWQSACEQLPAVPLQYPLAGPIGTTDNVFVEAENALTNAPLNGYTWATDTTENYSGVSDLASTPDSGNTFTNTQAVTKSPRLDFEFTLTAGTYYVWVRMYGVTNGDSVFVGLSATTPPTTPTNTAMTPPTEGLWSWVPSAAYAVTTGNYYASVYMRKDGVKVDAIAISEDGTHPPTENQNVWAYATNPKLSQPTTCNINSTSDTINVTGAEANCYANGRYTLPLASVTTDLNTVVQSLSNTVAPSIVIATGAATAAGTYSQSGTVATFTLKDGSSTVTNFEALFASATNTLLSIRAHGTAANVFHMATDVVASHALAPNHAFDMTGNVKEWALARSSNQDPIRGGAADNDEAGSTCDLNFSLATDTFLFPNVGFRCCR